MTWVGCDSTVTLDGITFKCEAFSPESEKALGRHAHSATSISDDDKNIVRVTWNDSDAMTNPLNKAYIDGIRLRMAERRAG